MVATQPSSTAGFWQLMCDQLLTWPADQPRHATLTYGDPVETDRPLPLVGADGNPRLTDTRPPTAGSVWIISN